MSFFKKLSNFFTSRKFIVNLLLFFVVWFAIVYGGKSYFDSYTHHGEEIVVPNLLNNNIKDVDVLIGDQPLRYEILDSIYNPDLLEGTIVYQNPMPTDSSGLTVKAGRTIRLRVTKQTRLVNVPIVVSKSERFAEGVLASKGLRTRIKHVPSREDQGSVISQTYNGKDVYPGQQVPINSIMELTVGKRGVGNMVTVPNLQGLTIKEAYDRLNGTGLRPYLSCSQCLTESDSLNFVVIRQTPVAADSSQIPEGSPITIFAASSFDSEE